MAGSLFVDDAGNVKKVTPEIAEQSGWKPAERADIERAIKIAETESVGGHLKQAGKAAAAGAFDVATAPARLLSAGAAAVTGGEDMLGRVSGNQFLEDVSAVGTELAGHGTAEAAGRKFQQQRQLEAEVNPGTETAGYIAGQVGGALATGGGSLAAGAGAGTTRALGGGFLARTAGRALTGAIEGAPIGMTQAQHDAYIEGRHLTAEQSMAAAGVGAILGGGISAGAGAAGEGLSKVFGKVKEGAQRLADKVGEGGALRKALGTSDEAVANTVASTLGEDVVAPEVVQHVRDGFSGKNLATVRAETEGAAAREMRASVNQIEGSTKQLTPEWREFKYENVAKTIARDEESAAQQSVIVRDRLADVRQRVDAMRADPTAYGERAAVNKLEGSLQLAERKASAALESGDMAKAYTALDTLKRDMGPIGRKNALVSSDQAAVAEVRDIYEGLRQDLTHEAWGGAGVQQQKTNAAFEEWLGTKHLFDRQFMTETGKEGWQKTYGADPAKLESWVGGLGQARNDLQHAIVEQHLDSTQKLARALSEAGELTPAKAAELKSIETAAKQFQATVTKVQKQVSAVDQAQNFIATTTGSQGVFSGATIAGSVVGGLPGAAVGMGLDAVMNPGKFLAQRMKFEQMAIKTTDRLGQGLDKFFGSMRGSALGQKIGEAAQATARTARAASVPSALGAFGAAGKTPLQAFESRRDEIMTASADNNGGVRQALAAQYGDVVGHDPHGFAGAVLTASNALDFLRGKMPMSGPDPESLTPMTTQLQPSKVEIQEFAETWNAVNDPVSVVEAMADGQMPGVDAVEAVQTVFPALYQQMQSETMARIRKQDEAGDEIPIYHRMMLDTLLGLDGAGEPTFAPSFGAKYGPTMGAPVADQGPPPGRKGGQVGSLGKRLQTRTQTMLGG